MGRRQCNRCTRFFDPNDPKDPCWCAPVATPADTFLDRAVAFFVSCYHSVEPKRAEVLVNFVVCYAGELDEHLRYSAVSEAAAVPDAKALAVVIRRALPKLDGLAALPPIVDDETSRLMGHPLFPQDPAVAQAWLKDAFLDRPMTLSAALQGWFSELGFPVEFCDTTTLEFSVELAEWILGARRG